MIDPKMHSENRGWIEGFLRFIPGFRGYLERDYRQESDRMTRIWMADRLQLAKAAVDEYMLSLVNAGRLDALNQCERLKNRIDSLINKMRSAVRGYSGFFDFVRVDEALLDRIYQHDLAMVEDIQNLAAAAGQLSAKPDPSGAAEGILLQQVAELDARFTERADLLNGVGK